MEKSTQYQLAEKTGNLIAEKNARIAQLEAENEKLVNALIGIDELLVEEMGDWYFVEFGKCPAKLANIAHIRDHIKTLKLEATK